MKKREEKKKNLISQFNKFKIEVLSRKNFLLIVHPKPDADALGSAFALRKILKDKKKDIVDIFSIDKPNKDFKKIFPLSNLVFSFQPEKKYDCLIVLDRGDIFNKFSFDKKITQFNSLPLVVNIDHHPKTFIKEALNILDEQAAATCEIIFKLIKFLENPIDQELAQYLLNGIYADTGGFRHSNTSAETLEIASELMKKGASISKINRVLFSNKSLNTLKLWAIALERAQINPQTGMVASFITQKDLEKYNATLDDVAGISEILNTIADSKFSLVLSEKEQNKIKASLRSDENKGVDVSKIARYFKGGGHRLASGFEIKGKLKQEGNHWIIE